MSHDLQSEDVDPFNSMQFTIALCLKILFNFTL